MLKRFAILVRGAGLGGVASAASGFGGGGALGKSKSSGNGCGFVNAVALVGLGMYGLTAGAGNRVCGCGTADSPVAAVSGVGVS